MTQGRSRIQILLYMSCIFHSKSINLVTGEINQLKLKDRILHWLHACYSHDQEIAKVDDFLDTIGYRDQNYGLYHPVWCISKLPGKRAMNKFLLVAIKKELIGFSSTPSTSTRKPSAKRWSCVSTRSIYLAIPSTQFLINNNCIMFYHTRAVYQKSCV